MAAVRFIAGMLEVCAALLMLKSGQVNKALQINAVLGMIGPLMMLTAATLGLAGIVGRVSPFKLIYIALGVLLILLATRG
ncbi:MAG: YqhV family protein [Firmicutes bacterium]|nr:YqhV family protein [Bacillota bacterium]